MEVPCGSALRLLLVQPELDGIHEDWWLGLLEFLSVHWNAVDAAHSDGNTFNGR